MKRDFLKIRKRLIVGCLAAAIAVAQPVSSVFANPHYDRRDTVAEGEFIYSARTSGQTQNLYQTSLPVSSQYCPAIQRHPCLWLSHPE